ncbi:MAG: hypothetical protein ACT4PT_00045 [Methanobacteriota archaeon]
MQKKHLVVLGFAVLATAPGALAFATSVSGRTALFSDMESVHYGHTTYVALFEENVNEKNTTIDFAAIASVSIERTMFVGSFNRGGVLWFNDSLLFDKFQNFTAGSMSEACLNNSAVHVVAGGSLDPRLFVANGTLVGLYLESYRTTDPNGQTYVTDAYLYGVPPKIDFVTNTGACIPDPTLATAGGHPDPPGEGGSMDQYPGAAGTGLDGHYNAVNVVRLGGTKATADVPCGNPNSLFLAATGTTAHPNATTPSGDGESHHHNTTLAAPAHTHPTAITDLYWTAAVAAPVGPRCVLIDDLTANEGTHTH